MDSIISAPSLDQITNNNELPSSKLEKCMNCYRKDIVMLKIQNQELERMLENSNEPNSNLIQAYKLIQIERDQLYKENIKLKKSLSKYRRSSKQRQILPRKETEESIIAKNISLLSENNRLKMQIEKKNFSIEKMRTKFKEKDSSYMILSKQYTILLKEKQLLESNLEKKESQIKSADNEEPDNQTKNIPANKKQKSNNISVEQYNKIVKILKQLKKTNLSLCNKIEKQKQMIDQLSSENISLKNFNKKQEDANSNNEDKNEPYNIAMLKEKLKQVEREKNILHERIDQNEILIEQLKMNQNGEEPQHIKDILRENEELKSKNMLLQKQIEVSVTMQKENIELKKENKKMKSMMMKQVSTQTNTNMHDIGDIKNQSKSNKKIINKNQSNNNKDDSNEQQNEDHEIDNRTNDEKNNVNSSSEKVIYFPVQNNDDKFELKANEDKNHLDLCSHSVKENYNQDKSSLSMKDDINLLQINPINVINDQGNSTNNDRNTFLIPINKNDPANINININLKIKNDQVSFFEDEENSNDNIREFNIEEESLSIISQITYHSKETNEIISENHSQVEVITSNNSEEIFTNANSVSSIKDQAIEKNSIQAEEEEELESGIQITNELNADDKISENKDIDKNDSEVLEQQENALNSSQHQINSDPSINEEEDLNDSNDLIDNNASSIYKEEKNVINEEEEESIEVNNENQIEMKTHILTDENTNNSDTNTENNLNEIMKLADKVNNNKKENVYEEEEEEENYSPVEDDILNIQNKNQKIFSEEEEKTANFEKQINRQQFDYSEEESIQDDENEDLNHILENIPEEQLPIKDKNIIIESKMNKNSLLSNYFELEEEEEEDNNEKSIASNLPVFEDKKQDNSCKEEEEYDDDNINHLNNEEKIKSKPALNEDLSIEEEEEETIDKLLSDEIYDDFSTDDDMPDTKSGSIEDFNYDYSENDQ